MFSNWLLSNVEKTPLLDQEMYSKIYLIYYKVVKNKTSKIRPLWNHGIASIKNIKFEIHQAEKVGKPVFEKRSENLHFLLLYYVCILYL